MASPTSTAERRPRANTITTITKITAAITFDSRSVRKVRTSSLWSCRKVTFTVSGQSPVAPSTVARTAATVSMMLAPERFVTSSASAGCPSMRAKPVGSSNARRTVATSSKVTTASSLTLIGISSTSSSEVISPGTFSTMRPAPVSIAPAAIRRLLRCSWPISSSKDRL